MFENRVQRRTFVPKKKEVREGSKVAHEEDSHK
jgi:hypothetical protein